MNGPRRDGPSRRDPNLTGLEIWLTGTRAELHAATATLAAAGHLTHQGQPRPLTGTDTGRYALYLRLTVATNSAPTRRPATSTAAGGALIDLDAARTTRRPTRKETHGA